MSISDELLRQAMSQIPVSGQSQEDEEQKRQEFREQLRLQKPDTVYNRITSGLRGSVSGILSGHGLSLADLKARGVRDPNFVMDSIENLSTAVGDLPGMFAGGAGGAAAGAAVGPLGSALAAGAGAFATPEIIKAMYQEYLNYAATADGEYTFGDFIKGLGRTAKSGAIAGAEGAAFAGMARFIEPLIGMKQFSSFFNMVPTKVGKKLAKASVATVGEAGAMTAAGAATRLLTGEDISGEDFFKNLAMIIPFKISHSFAGYVKRIAKENKLQNVLEKISEATNEGEARKLLQITYQPEGKKSRKEKVLERKGIEEGEKGGLIAKAVELEKLSREKPLIEDKVAKAGKPIQLGTDVKKEQPVKRGERYQEKKELEAKRLGEFKEGTRVGNKTIKGVVLRRNEKESFIKTDEGKLKRFPLEDRSFEELVPAKAVESIKKQKRLSLLEYKAKEQELETRKKLESATQKITSIKEKKGFETIKQQLESVGKRPEYAEGYIAEFKIKGEPRAGKIVNVTEKTVTIRDPETQRTHRKNKEDIKILDRSSGIPPSLLEKKGGREDWVYSKEAKKPTKKESEVKTKDNVPSKPIARRNIIQSIERLFKIPIKKGGIKGGKGTKGIFKSKERVIRTRDADDIQTSIHELAHDLDKNIFGRDFSKGKYKELEPYREELENVATITKDDQDPISEGFAEAVRIWLYDREASERETPEFKRYWEKKLAEYPDVLRSLDEVYRQYEDYKGQSDRNWLKGEIHYDSKTPFRDKIKDIITKKSVRDNLWSRFIENFFDRYHGFKKFSESTYRKARLFSGVTGKIQQFVKYGTFDWGKPFKITGKGLESIIRPALEVSSYRDIDAYLAAKRAVDLSEREEPIITQFDPERARKVANEYEKEFPIFKKVGEELQTYQDAVLRYLRDAGILSKETYDKIKDMNQFYIPFYRFIEATHPAGGMRPVNNLEAFSPLKRIKGGKELLLSPLESIYKNTALYLDLAERNGVLQELYKDLGSRENIGAIFEDMGEVTEGKEKLLEQAYNLTGDAADAYDLADENLLSMAMDETAVKNEGNQIKIYIDGKPQIFEVDPVIHRAIKGMRREEIPTLLKVLEYPAKTLRFGSTMTPDFITRSFLKDIPEALFKTQYGLNVLDYTKGIAEAYREITGGGEIYQMFLASGAAHSGFISMNRKHFVRNMEEFGRKLPALKNVIVNEKMGLQKLSEIAETIPRFLEFKKGIEVEMAKNNGVLTQEAFEKVALSARNITIDFARMGAKMSVFNRLVPFSNAHLQGWVTFAETLFPKLRNGTVTLKDTIYPVMRLGATMVLPSIVLATMNAKEKWYQEIPQYQKDNFWLFKFGDTILRLPKPYEMSIAANAAERFIEYAQGTDPKAFEKWYKHIITLAAVPHMLPAIAPLLEGWADKTFFTGRPITPQNTKGLMPQYQYGVYTSELAKKFSKNLADISGNKLLVSPAIAENYVRAWGGTLGMYMLKTADWSLEKMGLVNTVKPDPRISDYPLLRSFTVNYPLQGSQSVNEFFEKYTALVSKEKTIKTLMKEGHTEDARKLMKDFKGVIGKDAYKALVNMMGTVKGIYKNNNLTSKEKRDLIDQIYFQMTTVASHALPLVDADYRKLIR